MRRMPVFLSSVRARLALWNVLVLALLLAIVGVLLRASLAVNLKARVDRDLEQRASGLVDHWPFPVEDREARQFMDRMEQRRNQRDHRRTWGGPPIYSKDGYRRYASGDSTTQQALDLTALRHCFRTGAAEYSTTVAVLPLDGPLESSGSDKTTEPQLLRVYTAPLRSRDGQVEAVLQSATPLTPIYEELDRLTRTLLTLMPVGLVIAALGGLFLTDRALRPVRAITEAASQVGARVDLSARLAVNGDDEFARLSATFNGMLGRLEEAFVRLEDSYDQQRRFVADASHELRTPLTIIKANTSLALAEEGLLAEYREVLEEVDSAADRTNRIVQDLFMLARSDVGQLPIEHAEVPVGELLAQVRRETAHLHPAGALVEIEEETSNGPLVLNGDRHHLVRLLTNLVDNALRHTPPDGRVTVSVCALGLTQIFLKVRDTGEGIPPEHLPHITERFYRVDASRHRGMGGTGLGLAICHAITVAHGGTMTVESAVGIGTTVLLGLPRYR